MACPNCKREEGEKGRRIVRCKCGAAGCMVVGPLGGPVRDDCCAPAQRDFTKCQAHSDGKHQFK